MKSGYLPKIIKRLEDGSYTPHTQIIVFRDGTKRTIANVKWIWDNEFVHLVTENDREFIINKSNVNYIQRYIGYKNDAL